MPVSPYQFVALVILSVEISVGGWTLCPKPLEALTTWIAEIIATAVLTGRV
jgi:hypothetical protein